MNILGWLTVTLLLGLDLVQTQKLTPLANTDAEISSQYTSTVISKDSEDDVEIRDKNGNLVSTTELFLNEGYQIEIPADRNVCLIRASDDNSTCYSEEPVIEQITKTMLDHCAGRQIVALKPVDCETYEVEDNGEDAIESNVGPIDRERRSNNRPPWDTCCRYKYTISSKCVRTKCCRTFLVLCTNRCCTEHRKELIWTKQCAAGYTRQFHVPF